MNAVEGMPAAPSTVAPGVPDLRPDALPTLCPYLATEDGSWRSATAVRDHRCTAVAPPVPLALEKQRRLCLTDGYLNCATYGAALAAHPAPTEGLTGHARPIARMTPVILDQGRFDLRIPAWRADRPSGQAALVGLLGIAVVAILVARPSGDAGAAGPLAAAASPSPDAGTPTDAIVLPTIAPPTATAPVVTEAPAPTATSTTTPSAATASASPSVAASAEPSTGATYRVKRGDTLSAIAARFGTTTQVLVDLNDLADPSKLSIGQLIRLP